MAEVWETAFVDNQLMWGESPAQSALLARDRFVGAGVTDVLIPGIGYGRNAKPFLEAGMRVTGIEISPTAVGYARSRLHLDIPIFTGSVTDMPFDDTHYGGIFCYGLIYLLDPAQRAKLIRDCRAQSDAMMFTVISKTAPQYGKGTKLDEDWYQPRPGMTMYFYDRASIEREFGDCEISEIVEGAFPFFNVYCRGRSST